MKNNSISLSFIPQWENINIIRKKTYNLFKKFDHDIAEESKLVASELCENAVKYSDIQTIKDLINFNLNVHPDKIVISVNNTFNDKRRIQELTDIIDKINKSEQSKTFYEKRMFDLLNSSNYDKSRLGLFRIIYETDYILRYELNSKFIKIIAERKIT